MYVYYQIKSQVGGVTCGGGHSQLIDWAIELYRVLAETLLLSPWSCVAAGHCVLRWLHSKFASQLTPTQSPHCTIGYCYECGCRVYMPVNVESVWQSAPKAIEKDSGRTLSTNIFAYEHLAYEFYPWRTFAYVRTFGIRTLSLTNINLRANFWHTNLIPVEHLPIRTFLHVD